jgi:hypothetical protein
LAGGIGAFGKGAGVATVVLSVVDGWRLPPVEFLAVRVHRVTERAPGSSLMMKIGGAAG